jgi:hypothetical protein
MLKREIRVPKFCFLNVWHFSNVGLPHAMADIDEPQPGGVLFETADGRLSWRPRRAGSINKSHLHIIQEAWAISDGDGANLTTRQLLMLNHLPIIQRRSK